MCIRDRWERGNWFLHHDNPLPILPSTSNSCQKTRSMLPLTQSSYLRLFCCSRMKKEFKGKHFCTMEEVKETLLQALDDIPLQKYLQSTGFREMETTLKATEVSVSKIIKTNFFYNSRNFWVPCHYTGTCSPFTRNYLHKKIINFSIYTKQM